MQESLSFFISKGTMCHIFGPIYLSTRKPDLAVLLTLTESQFVSGCIAYCSIQKFHALSDELYVLLFYTALLLIFLDFLHQ